MSDKTRKVDDVNKDSAHLIKCYWCNTTILSTDNFCLRCGKIQTVRKSCCLIEADKTSTKS